MTKKTATKSANSGTKRVAKSADAVCRCHSLPVEFLCLKRGCFRELCGHCLLIHKEHVADVKPLKDVIHSALSKLEDAPIEQKREELITT